MLLGRTAAAAAAAAAARRRAWMAALAPAAAPLPPPPPPAATPPARVPVTIVTGALGSGKTTLLRWILTGNHGKRIAVIENEFAQSLAGEGGIESLVLKDGVDGAVADGFYELANGCVCCSVRDGLVQTLLTLMERRDRFDYVLVETSGLADPGPVASVFWTDLDDAESPLSLDGIVTVVDARHVGAQLARRREAGAVNETLRQLAHADVVLLNKTDLLAPREGDGAGAGDERALEQLEQRVRGINAGASVLRCTRAEVPLHRILGLRAYEDAPSAEQQRLWLAGEEEHAPAGALGGKGGGGGCSGDGGDGDACSDSRHEHEHHHHHHRHDSRVTSVSVTSRLPVDAAAFKSWVGELLWEHRVPGDEAAAGAVPGSPDAQPLQQPGIEEDDEAPALVEAGGGDAAVAALGAAALREQAGAADEHGGGMHVFRGKGVLYVAATAEGGGGSNESSAVPHIFQSVHALFDVNAASGASAAALNEPTARAAGSRLLFIGEGLDGPALQRSFDALCARAAPGARGPG